MVVTQIIIVCYVVDKIQGDLKMALEYKVENVEELSEEVRGLYKETEGGFILDVEGGVKPMSEFDTVYGALQKEKTDHKASKEKNREFGDYTPEMFQELEKENSTLKLSSKDDKKDVEKRLAEALEIQMKPVNADNSKLKTELDSALTTISVLKQEKINGALRKEISQFVLDAKNGLKAESMEDIIARATVQGVSFNEDVGKFVTTDGLPLYAWIPLQAKNSTWYKPTEGAGALGGKKGISGDNPFKTGDLGAQTRLWKEDQNEYYRLQKLSLKG